MSADIPRRAFLSLPPAAALLIAASSDTALAQPPPGRLLVSGYRVVDLGTGDRASRALAINSSGTVAGYAHDATGRRPPVIWSKGRIRDIGPAIAEYGTAHGINDRGDVIGTWGTMAGAGGSFLWSAGRRTTLPKTFSPRAINGSRRIAGAVQVSSGETCPAVWFRGRVTSLRRQGLTAGPSAAAVAINEAGQIAGVDGVGPFLLSRGTVRRPPPGASRLNGVHGLNARGDVVGWGSIEGGTSRPMLWTRSGMVDVAAPGVPGRGGGNGVNASRQVAGVWITDEVPDGTPAIWTRRQMTLLPLLGHAPGVARAEAVNDHGVIAGSSTPAKDLAYENARAVLWIPTSKRAT